jgi:ribonuclease HII
MEEFDQLYPQYGLAQNKGYGTPDHLDALRRHGPSPLHRYSYAPVREARCWSAGAEQAPLPLEGAADGGRNSLADSIP